MTDKIRIVIEILVPPDTDDHPDNLQLMTPWAIADQIAEEIEGGNCYREVTILEPEEPDDPHIYGTVIRKPNGTKLWCYRHHLWEEVTWLETPAGHGFGLTPIYMPTRAT